jgi:sortase A
MLPDEVKGKGTLSLGLILLGIGCISWALIHINKTYDYTADKSRNTSSSLPTEQLEENTGNGTAPMEKKPELFNSINQDEILYPIRPIEGDEIGTLTIPALEQEIPIFHGVNEDELEKGVGHFAQSVLPGEHNNSVLSGHRDTVFRQLGELKIGYQLIIQTSAGTFTYEINNTRIVDKDDRTVIAPTDHAVLTVTTCYPFQYIGAAPDRYILTAHLVSRA